MNFNNVLENIGIDDNKNKEIQKDLHGEIKEIAKEQTSFLETNLGQTINWGINLGIKAAIPDIIEDEVIEIKDALVEEGFMRSC